MGLIPAEVINQVLERCDIVSTISSYIPMKRAGRNFKALCPFHNEKTPSFLVNPDKQIYHCFGCGAGGNVISFVMQQERLEFPEAVRFLADKVGIVVVEENTAARSSSELKQQLFKINALAVQFFQNNLLTDRGSAAAAAREYLKKRAVGLEIVKKFQLGFALDQWDGLIQLLRKQNVSLAHMEKAGLIIPQSKGEGFYDRFRNRIIFPIFDVRGECLAFGARAMEADNPAKYINSPETVIYTKGHHLYGFNWAREAVAKDDAVVVVEGYLDFIMPFQAGVGNIVASLGTALTVDQIRLIRRYTENVVMLFDGDKAGESATVRSLDLLIAEGMTVKIATLTEGEDPDSFIRKSGVEQFRRRIAEAQSLFDFKLQILLGKFDRRTIEGRAKICGEILPTISKIPNEIIKSEYLKRLAQNLAIDPKALQNELQRTGSKAPMFAENSVKPKTPVSIKPAALHPAERDLLRLMLHESEFVPLTRSVMAIADFENEYVRRVVEKIFQIFDEGKEPIAPTLMTALDDQRIIQMVSSLLVSEDALVGDKMKMHSDCIERLRQDRVKKQRKVLLHEMHAAKASGDQRQLEELTQQFNQLIKG